MEVTKLRLPVALSSCKAYVRAVSVGAHRGIGCRLAWRMPWCGTGPVAASLVAMPLNTKVTVGMVYPPVVASMHATSQHRCRSSPPAAMHRIGSLLNP